MNWKSKAAIQKAISFLPGKTSLNRQMQRVTGGLKLSDQQFEWKIGHARDHYQYYTDYCQKPFSDTRVLELGTGWYPIIPIYFFLKGCRSFDSIDIYQWLKVENYYSVIAMYRAWRDDGRLDAFIDDIDESNWDILMRILAGDLGVEEINERIFFNPMLGDASTTSKISSGYDLICSNNVLEHIYPKSLEPILARFHGLVNEGGVMSHFIDLSDHFAHSDANITIYNFLQFGERQWRWIDNDIQPQNRLRWSDYVGMFNRLGIACTIEDTRAGLPESFDTISLSSRYRDYERSDLMISHGQIVSHY